ncbi:hypothetical protein M9H77_12118 [Catharanthus roseus]|uniref:Uncharacterized protein n=1 Tax=Catharanthus roseus TaxID=4058 RepID=A0ACC0BGL1_CATRO|nr:hypothetical protein M9H77_12118 [Catharanthus roseus]
MKKERSSHSKIKELKTLKSYVLVRDVLSYLGIIGKPLFNPRSSSLSSTYWVVVLTPLSIFSPVDGNGLRRSPKNTLNVRKNYFDRMSEHKSQGRKGETTHKERRKEGRVGGTTTRSMVFNSPLVIRVANVSANACQYIACNPERLPSDQVLYLLFCFPFQQIRRLALCLWTFFCCPLPDPSLFNVLSSPSSSSSSSSSSSDSDFADLHPHLH